MIVVDSSAVVAIMFGEAEAPRLIERLVQSPAAQRLISAANYVETATVLAGRHRAPEQAIADLDGFLSEAGIKLVGVDEDIARRAASARIRYGKGFGGTFNFGDSFAYALAAKLNAPLLFVGDDFAATDIRPA